MNEGEKRKGLKKTNKEETKKVYLLDTSAVVTYLADEEGSGKVADILNTALFNKISIFLSFMSLMELEYNYLRKGGKEKAQEVLLKLRALPLKVSFENDPSFIHQVAEIKAETALSVADAWIAALALKLNAILVHKDPEFEVFSRILKLSPLPYRKN